MTSKNSFNSLYLRALSSKRNGHLYSAFPYPTKISAESIALFIAAHTNPGDTVFDGFAGSGTTGLAALLCENPTKELCQEADKLGLSVEWGARNAVLYELSALGGFVGKTLVNPPDPKTFRKIAENILCDAENEVGWMYKASDPNGNDGTIRHIIWSDILFCPVCHRKVTLWDACVSLSPARIDSCFNCPSCTHRASLNEVNRMVERILDDITCKYNEQRVRQIARIYGVTGNKRWSRSQTKGDLKLLDRIATEPIPSCVPKVSIPWGDLYRRGYHQGITDLHHFYTRRNLIVFAHLWARTEEYDGNIRDALRFWLLSYNASHSTIMTRVVAKSGQKDMVVTSAQPGVLYVSGLPVEKNLLSGLRRKITTIADAFAVIFGRKGRVEVHQKSSCNIDLPDCSIDYVFTDPPFGGNIPYSEINFLNEAWLGKYTDRSEEVIISKDQEKGLSKYQALLTSAFIELQRIIKPNGKITLVFHSASADVWNSLQTAYSTAGLSVESAGVLDKKQGSFKQVTTAGAVRGDPILLLCKKMASSKVKIADVWLVAEQLLRNAGKSSDPGEQTAQRLYSRLVSHYLSLHQQVPVDAESFYRWYAEQPVHEVIALARS